MEYQFHISNSKVYHRPEAEDNSLPRRSKRIQHHNKARLMPIAASKFASLASNDLLFEIFLRLSDRRIIIRCSAVCRRWLALITSSAPELARRHLSSHDPPSPYELFFTYRSPLNGATASRQSKLSEPNDYLKSLLGRYDVMASSEDLLLLTRWPTPMSLEYCVCNPLTRELVVLPQPPIVLCLRFGYYHLITRENRFTKEVWYGLVCKGKGNEYCCKVILIVDCNPDITTVIYCSQAQRWSELVFSISRIHFDFYGYFGREFVTCNGILYASFSAPEIDTNEIVAIDAFNNHIKDPEQRCSFIKLPDGFGFEDETKRFRIGVVQGRLRLSKLFHTRPNFSIVKIWELNSGLSWDLVDEARVWLTKRREFLSVLAFDPNSSDFYLFVTQPNSVSTLHSGKQV